MQGVALSSGRGHVELGLIRQPLRREEQPLEVRTADAAEPLIRHNGQSQSRKICCAKITAGICVIVICAAFVTVCAGFVYGIVHGEN